MRWSKNWQHLRRFHWKPIAQIFVVAGFFFMLGFFIKYHYPQLKILVLSEIRELSRREWGLEIQPREIELSVWPAGIQFIDLEVKGRKERKKDFPQIFAKHVAAYIDIFGLLTGHLRLSKLEIREPTIFFIQKIRSSTSHPQTSFELSFRALKFFPIQHIRIERMNLDVRLMDPKIILNTQNFSCSVQNLDGALAFDIDGRSIFYEDTKKNLALNFSLNTKGLVDRNKIQFNNLRLQKQNSEINLQGTVQGKIEEHLIHDVEFETKLRLDLSEIKHWLTQMSPFIFIPEVAGFLEGSTQIKYSNSVGISGQFTTQISNLKIDKFILGHVQTQGHWTRENIKLNHLLISNIAGDYGLRNSHISLGDKTRIQSDLDIKGIELQKLLNTLGVPNVPTTLDIAGQFKCDGEIHPDLDLNCQGLAEGQNLHVYAGKKPFSIVKLPKFEAQGQVQINKHSVSYKANLKIKEFQGQSHGVIDFEKGFKIFYDTPAMAFSVLNHFVGLKFEGQAQITGSTEGNAHTATVSTQVHLNRFWLEDYLLDNVSLNFSYAHGQLGFNHIQGTVDSTSYEGQVQINLPNEQIQLSVQSSDADLRDIKKVLSRRLQLPMDMSGVGKIKMNLHGPLNIEKVNFHLLSQFSDGKIATESFDNLIANIAATDGLIRSEKIILTKNASQIFVKGTLSPDRKIQLTASGNQIRLEESQFLKARLQELRGQMDFDMVINGPLHHPQSQFKGYLSQMSLGTETIESSTFSIEFGNRSVWGYGKLFGGRVRTEFEIPYELEAPFRIYLNAKEWNFLPLVGLLIRNERHWDYKSQLSGILDIQSPRGGFWKATGVGQIDYLKIERGPVVLVSQKPTKITFQDGLINSSTLNLKGLNSFLNVTITDSRQDSLNISALAKADLSLFALAAPFLKEMRGLMTLSLKIHDRMDSPNILGSAFIENGLVKLPDFPQPFQNIQADLLFNNKKILINSLNANLGGGRIQGGGGITLNQQKMLEIAVQGSFEQVHLTLPEGVKSVGSGSVAISGTGFPYKLSIQGTVTSGEITREFSSDSSQGSTIKQSALLPKKAVEKETPFLNLDLNLLLSENIKIKNDLLETAISGQLQISGEPTNPMFTGQINLIKGGKIYFRKTPFEISSGIIRFKEIISNPDLYISSSARVQDYDITLLLQGTGLKPVIELTSTPSLTEPEIICLLALGVTCDTMEKKVVSSEQGQASYHQIGAALLSNNPLQKQIKERYGVEVGFSTAFDSDNSSVPQVTIGKQITPQVGAKVVHSRGKEPKVDAQVFWNLNKNWSFVGSWEGRTEESPTDKTSKDNTTNNTFGLDLEYKLEFK